MGEPTSPTPQQLAWLRIHPDAINLADRIAALQQHDSYEPIDETNAVLDRIIEDAAAFADRCEEVAVRRVSPTGEVLPSWPMVVQRLRRWREQAEPAGRMDAAARARHEAYEACHWAFTGRLTGEPWPS